MKTHNFNSLCKMGSWNLIASSGVIFHSSLVLTAGWVIKQCHCVWLVYLSRLYFCISSFSWDVEPEKSWRWTSCFLVRGEERERTQLLHCLNPMFLYSSVGWIKSNSTQCSSHLWSQECGQVWTLSRVESNWEWIWYPVHNFEN